MIALNFRTKLLLAMMLIVVGVTATTLLITENQVRVSYERHFQQSFIFQTEFFLQKREARLTPVQERVANAAGNPRLIASMENAGQAGADQQDVDDLYQNGTDQLLEVVKTSQDGRTNVQPAFFFFLNSKGQVLVPSKTVRLPFSFPGLQRITPQVEAVSRAVTRAGAQQVGYLAPQESLGRARIREMVFTPIIDQVSQQTLGVLSVGFPLPETDPPESRLSQPRTNLAGGSISHASSEQGAILSGIWLDGRLYSSSLPPDSLGPLEQEIGDQLHDDRPPRKDFMAPIARVPHQVYCQALKTGRAFPPAYQVCLYSLAEAVAETRRFRRKILISGSFALLAALGLSLLISRGLAVPLQELAAGTAQIERGNYEVKVPVRSGGEIGRLGQAFNDMTARLQASYLAQEQRIAERTQELAERKRAEEALRQSEASLRQAQRIAHLGNWQWNILTNQLAWSDEIYSIFGLAPQQFGASYEAFLERVHPQDRKTIVLAVSRSIETGQPYSLDHRILRPDGEVRIVHEQAEVTKDESGRAVQMIGTVQDITEQKRIEAEFLRAQRMNSIGSLAGGMAHDLNNALSPILMGIQLIRRKLRDPETQQMLTVMEANTHRGADMVRQVLTFAGGREGGRELLDLGRLIREMEHIVRQTLPKSISVTAMVPQDLWPVAGNSTQLHQVLLNLCINARDAMPKGGQLTLAADNVELRSDETKGIPNAAPGRYVMLLVADTGTGIDPKILPHIFEPFFTTKGTGQGTGLGLSTIARIVTAHGGFVGVKSEPGAGATFEIYFPRGESAPAAEPVRSAVELPWGHSELILLIEDDRSVREIVASSLVEYGYRVVTAANGAEAITLLDQHKDDLRLVLTNFLTPGIEGTTTVELVRARCPDVPMILMSGEPGPLTGSLMAPATAFLPKPFPLELLLITVAKALRR